MKLIAIASGDPLWPAVSIFVRTAYLDSYGARLAGLPATMVALVDGQSRILCAAGLRSAPEPFLSESYLEAPVEAVIAERTGKSPRRSEFVEATGLASRMPALSVHFMRELILYGETLGFNWAFFTATNRLEKLLRRINLPLIELGHARRERVPGPEAWGTYYDNSPTVLAIGREHLAPFLARHEDSLLVGARCAVNG